MLKKYCSFGIWLISQSIFVVVEKLDDVVLG